ncbi:MAG: hypothetical protein RR140_03430 [Clostridia bacterium]
MAKNKVVFGFIANLIIFLIIIAGVCLVFSAIMIISPGTKIFNVVYIRNNEKLNYFKIDNEYLDEFKVVEINVDCGMGSTKIEISQNSNLANLGFQVTDKCQGFCDINKNQKTNFIFTKTLTSENKIKLNFKLTKYPECFLFLKKQVDVKVCLPSSVNQNNIKINLNAKL